MQREWRGKTLLHFTFKLSTDLKQEAQDVSDAKTQEQNSNVYPLLSFPCVASSVSSGSALLLPCGRNGAVQLKIIIFKLADFTAYNAC